MAFEYNGVVYRDLEPQVRYDAEQIQLLKQADVAINENLQTVNESLQTVNTEINGKLTKPTNPTAESAVTLLADGTVGTKLLSEIGGGGGGKRPTRWPSSTRRRRRSTKTASRSTTPWRRSTTAAFWCSMRRWSSRCRSFPTGWRRRRKARQST